MPARLSSSVAVTLQGSCRLFPFILRLFPFPNRYCPNGRSGLEREEGHQQLKHGNKREKTETNGENILVALWHGGIAVPGQGAGGPEVVSLRAATQTIE